jgi:hypothetical protein
MANRQEAIADLSAFIQRHVGAGFESDEELRQTAKEYCGDNYDEVLIDADVEAMLAEAIEEHRREQQSWPDTTDCDRLDAVFEDLEADGIVARQDFTCCQNCGHAEIDDEINQAREQHTVIGFAFYHQQDTERAVEGGGLILAYGALTGKPEDSLDIGKRIAARLRQHGLEVRWNEDVSKRIFVAMDWKRRRT